MLTRVTHLWNVDPVHPLRDELQPAADLLRVGGLVAFPTETVYGLGADALSAAAVARIFQAKGRPQDNPLIVHVSSLEMAYSLMGQSDERPILDILAAAFWPGPLTLVVTRNHRIGDQVTAGLGTVGLRMPSHPVALALIDELERPIAAPSANRSGRPSPTMPQHVMADLNGRIEGIVSAGACSVGVESTVLDITEWPPVLLRPGGATPEEISGVLGTEVVVDRHVHVPVTDPEATQVRSPGMKYRHYAPSTPLILVEASAFTRERLRDLIAIQQSQGNRVGILATDEADVASLDLPVVRMGSRARPDQIAANLFSALRHVDRTDVDVVLVEGIDDRGVGLAVMNRLRRAAGRRIG